MVELKKDEMIKIETLFENMHDTVILSCIQGHMGRAWVDKLDNPKFGLVQGGDFLFLAGDENSENASEIIEKALDITELNLAFAIPEKKEIGDLIKQQYGVDCKEIQRYGIKKKKDEFDIVKLQEIVQNLPREYELCEIDEQWYEIVLKEDWSESFVSNFFSKEDYINRGLGRIIIHNGKVVSGASSYTRYNEGIEIEIATKEDYRKQGLAQVVGAALILACRERGLYPSWDAANMTSVLLAEKLGYEYDKPYDTYMIRKNISKQN
jgi:GNAT superfamily N-acetyltransferase